MPTTLRRRRPHDHAKKEAGPNGGLLITAVEPHCELLVTPERKLKITFLGDDNKPVALKEQSVTATGGDRANPTQFTFTKEGESLVSEQALPAGMAVPLILQIKNCARRQVGHQAGLPEPRELPDLQARGVRLHLRPRLAASGITGRARVLAGRDFRW